MPEHLDAATARALVTDAVGRPLRRTEARTLAKTLRRITDALPVGSGPLAVMSTHLLDAATALDG